VVALLVFLKDELAGLEGSAVFLKEWVGVHESQYTPVEILKQIERKGRQGVQEATMQQLFGHGVALWVAVGLAACSPNTIWDDRPPRLVDTTVTPDGDELRLEFDEPVAEAVTGGDFTKKPAEPRVTGKTVAQPLPAGLKPGKAYQWKAEVTDAGRNLTSVAGRFYGPNDHPARLRLNEVRVAGSGPHSDMVELRVEEGGSLGGWTLEAFSGPQAKQRCILPDEAVEPGDFVVVRFKPGVDSAPGSRDYDVAGAKGLSAVKGCLALRPAPDRAPTDVLAYAKTPGEGAQLARNLGWTAEEADPSHCTATRTWCRSDEGWMLVANGCATPGAENKLTPWVDQPSSRKGSPKTKGRIPRSGRQRGWPAARESTPPPGQPATARPRFHPRGDSFRGSPAVPQR